MKCLPLVAAALLSSTVNAQTDVLQRGQGWSTQMGRTLGEGTLVGYGEIGWPGATAGALYGMHPSWDAGVQLTYALGLQGIPRYFGATSELRAQGVLRGALLDSGVANLAITFSPGVLFNFWQTDTYVGMLLPIGFRLGIPISAAVNAFGALDMPFYFTFGKYGSFNMPLLFGGGVEYFLDRNLAGFLRVQMGPFVAFSTGYTDFVLLSLLGVAYRL